MNWLLIKFIVILKITRNVKVFKRQKNVLLKRTRIILLYISLQIIENIVTLTNFDAVMEIKDDYNLTCRMFPRNYFST